MPNYLIAVPASVHVVVEADSEEGVTEELVADAVIEQHGKYIALDARTIGMDNFEILGED